MTGRTPTDRLHLEGRERPDNLPSTIEKIAGRWFGDAHASFEGIDVQLNYFCVNDHLGRGHFPRHTHPFSELFYTVQGRGRMTCRDQVLELGPGHAFVARPGDEHASEWDVTDDVTWRGLIFHFNLGLSADTLSPEHDLSIGDQFAPFYSYFMQSQELCYAVDAKTQPPIEAGIGQTLDLMKHHAGAGSAAILGLWLQVVSLISASLKESGTATGLGAVMELPQREQQLLRAKQMLGDETYARLTVAEVAEKVGMSKFHFMRAFREAFGMPPQKYRQNRVLERGGKLLAQTDRTLEAIAETLGYSSASAFSKAFRSNHSLSPSAYRKTFR